MATSEQLEALTQDPLVFFQELSSWCHMKAEQLDEMDDEAVGYHNRWAETAASIDLAIEFWREENFPNNQRHRLMAGDLNDITQIVQSYLPRP